MNPRPLLPALALALLAPSVALAEREAPASAPAPYSLPFQLRPAIAGNVIRSDTMLALREQGTTAVEMLLGAYKVSPDIAVMARQGWVYESPDVGPSGNAFSNLMLGATWTPKLGKDFRLAPFLGVALPTGQGGGNSPDATKTMAISAGVPARASMDNAMFARNDLVVFPGIGLAYIADGLTVQIEATVLELIRVRGEEKQPDADKTNLTGGLHIGYFLLPELSIGGELRHQRWLKAPLSVDANPASRDTTTVAAGVRGHFKLGDLWLRPALSYAQPLDHPMSDASYKLVQLDVPVAF